MDTGRVGVLRTNKIDFLNLEARLAALGVEAVPFAPMDVLGGRITDWAKAHLEGLDALVIVAPYQLASYAAAGVALVSATSVVFVGGRVEAPFSESAIAVYAHGADSGALAAHSIVSRLRTLERSKVSLV